MRFSELARFAGMERRWAFTLPLEDDATFEESEPRQFASGIAAADYDDDGDVDVLVVGGDVAPWHLYRNAGDGTYDEVAASVGLSLTSKASGPAFGDIDGDGDLDLFVGAIEEDFHFLFENRDGMFVDVTAGSGVQLNGPVTVSAVFADYDQDGDLDLFAGRWGTPAAETESLFRNRGDGTFEPHTSEAGLDLLIETANTARRGTSGVRFDYSFTPAFTDIDSDGDPDLLVAADFRTSQVMRNDGDGTFTRISDRDVLKDEAGMGAAVGDYDNDGDMDWLVTSIYQQNVLRGNRLYRNDGAGVFEDVTSQAGVQEGGWGWGACFADFDNDGHLDIFHTNGWRGVTGSGSNTSIEGDAGGTPFTEDPARFFHSRGDGTFVESSVDFGVDHTGQGRAVACFDADRNGTIDILVANNDEDQLIHYRNDTDNDNHYLTINLRDTGGNRFGIGSWITVTTENGTQVRELRGGNNFTSHNPFEVHFGLGDATVADVVVRWPDGSASIRESVAVDRVMTVERDGVTQSLSVVQGSGDGAYQQGDIIPLTAAAPAEDYFFSHWSSTSGGTFADSTSATTTFTMPAGPATVTANYVPGVAAGPDVSVPRRWSEVLLQSIRNDFARPTVHARNLFHVSAAMYDVWTVFDTGDAAPWLFGRIRAGVACGGDALPEPHSDTLRDAALSHAAYRIIRTRFADSPLAAAIDRDARALMGALGLDPEFEGVNYTAGGDEAGAALGNHIGECYLAFGLEDGSNESNDYANVAYMPVNPRLAPDEPGNPDLVDLNRWQALALSEFVDQAGNPVTSDPDFLSPEWGQVVPFALSEDDRTVYTRDGFDYWVYHDQGAPPLVGGALQDEYQWGFALVSIWSSHLDPADGVMVDISPASLGNIDVADYPTDFPGHRTFYATLAGGDASTGYATNPTTGVAYTPQLVPRGDYSRVLAEFWADGPDSETPPGHWFVILNEMNDHPDLERRFMGQGDVVDRLEWDVKGYFALGGAMHDAAITAWGMKGWYDYIRPISAIRAMADRGQSSDAAGASFDPDGIPLEPGFIEVIEAGDPLAGTTDEHVGKIKVLAWRGPDFVSDPDTDVAGVDWIRAEDWWPYQRPTFVTPPFAGYVSGHSTYSRAAAEVLTALTGDAFFPGGMSGFEIDANEFLVFEEGPSVSMTLQWATYRDASDQCSLSRIWGGIHPPADDIPGRLAGIEVGVDAFARAAAHFDGSVDTP